MKDVVNFMIENWYFIITAIVMVVMAAFVVLGFFQMPTKEQTRKVKEWLLWAVTQAEKDLGEGTGQLKLRQVYDMFVQRFPAIAKAVSFETFSLWVDQALVEMRDMIGKNDAVRELVGGGENG